MFQVKETSKVKQKIKKHQSLLEYYQLFPYGLEIEETIYYHIVYSLRFSQKVKGNLILTSEGDVPTFDEAKKPFWFFVLYNTSINTANKQLLKDRRVPLDTHEKLLKLLQEGSQLFRTTDSGMKDMFDHMINTLSFFINERKRLGNIEHQIIQLQDYILDERGYLYPEEVEQFEAYIVDYFEIMYRGGRITLETEPYEKILRFIETYKDGWSREEQDKMKQLEREIKTYISPSAIKTLKKSQRSFEYDKHGNHINFSPGETGIEEMVQNWREIGKYDFEHKVLPDLRNPRRRN